MSDLAIAKPLTLKCGLTLPNRLAKAALAEGLADKDALPSKATNAVYSEWAKGGWGLVMTGNVDVDTQHVGDKLNAAYNHELERASLLETWKGWARSCNPDGATPTVVQINHPGRQSHRGAGSRGLFAPSIAPSAVPLDFGTGLLARLMGALVFGTPREMTVDEIRHVVGRFAETAKLAAEAGFAGAEIHAAHGYLLAQFLSEKSNKRTDAYGGSPAARAKIVVEIIRAMRAAVPSGFCIGIKLNSADHQSPEELKACLEQLRLVAEAGVDFVEVSGGTYENPIMSTGTAEATSTTAANEKQPQKSERTKAREAFFLEFASAVRSEIGSGVPLMVTGGFRSRGGMEAALASGGCDLIGIGRPATVKPAFPKEILLNPEVKDEDASLSIEKIQPGWFLKLTGVHALGAAADSLHYRRLLQGLAYKAKA
ncbi:NADPH dehydrogenase [Apiospora rasikravindrae]|uniref:NADPH dehydrogenase n=1 Tax=Apiospora rasikravindrae TaxID=990691 RepID=A0ABR1TF95_9PEZI